LLRGSEGKKEYPAASWSAPDSLVRGNVPGKTIEKKTQKK